MEKNIRIIIACGGSGGHIFPALSLYQALKKKQGQAEIMLVSDKRAISDSLFGREFPHTYLALSPLRFKLDLQAPLFILKLLTGILQSAKFILSFQPDIVVGLGGYPSFFLVLFARALGKKTVIHESNIVPGQANRLLAYIADKIATGFVKTQDYFRANSAKLVFTGNPLKPDLSRLERARADELLGLQPDKFTILVMGGSQGAHKINSLSLSAAALIKDKASFQIIHLCGRRDYQKLSSGYNILGVRAKVFSFFKQMEYVYSAADIVISRAGSASINELAFFGLPAILIPYPYARRHQLNNAAHLQAHNAAIVIQEKQAYPRVVKHKILELFNNPGLRESISKNILIFSQPLADEALAELVLNEDITPKFRGYRPQGRV